MIFFLIFELFDLNQALNKIEYRNRIHDTLNHFKHFFEFFFGDKI